MKINGVDLESSFEKVRIPYKTKKGWSNYLVDFVDHSKRILYEIKPESIKEDCMVKELAAKKWCEEMSYEFEYVSDDWFKERLKHYSLEIIMSNIQIEYDVLFSRMKQFL